ncbi:MAG: hypothetical protein LPK79_14145, partial [Bacteroidota bacterium]|nr:hypothetical protein [Bacteroidota bacterium]
MPLKSFILFCFLVSIWVSAFAQTLPIGPKVPGIGGGLPKGIPTTGLEGLATKPEIPYLEELRQVQGLKKSYDSLRSEVKRLNEAAKDSTTQDSVVSVLKTRGQEMLDREAELLQSMLEEQEIPGEELKVAMNRTLEGVENSKAKLAEVSDFEGLDGILDQSEENLKALINEWIMPKIEQTLSGTLSEGWNPAAAKIPDFYGKDALDRLMQQDSDPSVLMAQAKETALGKAKHIPDEYLEKLDGKSAKLMLDTLGNVQVKMLKDPKRKFDLIEPNELKYAKLLERTGALFWYDPLTAFGEGIFAEAGLGYGFTQQLAGYGSWIAKRYFNNTSGPVREGDGLRLGLRFTKSTWGIQTSVARMQVDIKYPTGYEQSNYSGTSWSGELALVKLIPLGERIRSVVIASWDPFYQANR